MGKLAKQYNREEFDRVLDRLKHVYDIMPLTPYQWRFNNAIDIYPSNCKYFDIATKVRGDYHSNKRLEEFLKAYFNGEVT